MAQGRESIDIVFRDATELTASIREGKLTSIQVLEAFLGRIERHNGKINAVVTLDAEGAARAAADADREISTGIIRGPLHGLPVTVKDSFETAGMRTTSGVRARDHVPSRDSTVAARLKAAGAIILGKTNLPELLSGCHCCNPIFGRTNNPWDLSRTPGGSSGGSAAAVAAGMSAFDIGSDIKGSIRVPAHFCGVYGLKPTDFMVSSAGHVPGTPRGLLRYLISVGPLARSARDLRLALSVIAGEDGRLWEVPPAPCIGPDKEGPGEPRLILSEEFPGMPVDEEMMEVVHKAADRLSSRGFTVERGVPEGLDFQDAVRTNQEIEMTAMYARSPPWHIPRAIWRLASGHFPDNSFLAGSFAGAGSDLYRYSRALARRDACIGKVERFLSGYDAWLCPAAMVPALPHADLKGTMEVVMARADVNGREVPYDLATFGYTSPFNLTGSPVVCLPAGSTASGLPAGLQVVGKRWRDFRLLDTAELIAGALGPFRPPPGLD